MKRKLSKAKYIAPTVCAVLVIIAALLYAVALIMIGHTAPEALALFVIILAVCAALITGVIIALVQRYKEIQGGEEDDAADY